MKKINLLPLALFALISASIYGQLPTFKAEPVCLGELTRFEFDTTGFGDSVITGYLWDLQNTGQFVNKGNDFKYAYLDADTFVVTLQIITAGASYTSAPKDVVVYPIPLANFQNDNICQGKLATFHDISTIESGSIIDYSWDFDNDGTYDQNTTESSITVFLGSAGDYLTTLRVTSNKECRAYATKTISIYANPDADFEIQEGCVNSATQFTNTSTIAIGSIQMYIWDFGDGNKDISDGNVSNVYSYAGNFDATLIAVSENNCRDTALAAVTINPSPTINLNYNDTVVYTGQDINLIATGNYNSIEWSTGETTDSISVSDTGSYSVTASNIQGCSVSESIYVKIDIVTSEDDEVIVLKSKVLTPNGDGINDQLVIYDFSSSDKLQLVIYNILGDIVYESDNYQNDWEGIGLDPGSYFYIATAGSNVKKGTINILQ